MRSLENKVALVTGGGGDIGTASAVALAARGATVAVVDIDPKAAAATVDAVVADGGTALAIECDVSSRDACEKAASTALEAYGSVDVLVNLAAPRPVQKPLDEHTDGDMLQLWEGGLMSSFRFMQACYPSMVARGGGSIINTGSSVGTEGLEGFAAYAAAREGIRGMSRVAARDWGRSGIRVNVVCPLSNPPGIRTEDRGAYPGRYDRVPLGRIGDSALDIAPVIVFLASDESRYITGMTMFADGGLGMVR